MSSEQTLILVKPDGVKRGLVGEVIARIERKGGYLLGSILQLCLIGYGSVVTQMYFMGALFTALWIAAILLGRRGEAIKAKLIAERDKKGASNL